MLTHARDNYVARRLSTTYADTKKPATRLGVTGRCTKGKAGCYGM